jgi:hypothetical protein
MKLVLVELVTRYDVAVGPSGQGESSEGGWKRPETFNIKMVYYPDAKASVYMRDRKMGG